MRRITLLITATLLASSCSLRPTPHQVVTLANDHQTALSQYHKPLSPEELSEISRRLQALKTQQEHGDYSVQASKPKYAYKGIPGHRHIDQFSKDELNKASENELVVILFDNAKLDKLRYRLANMGYFISDYYYDTIIVRLADSGEIGIKKHFKILEGFPEVKVVSPRFYIDASLNSSDANLPAQWGVSRINAQTAWEYPGIRESTFKIAMLDTGVDWFHGDLSSKVSPDSIRIVRNTSAGHPQFAYDVYDQNGHGTRVAGIAAAATNNSLGIAGAGWGSLILALATEEPIGADNFPHDFLRYATQLATEKGAKVINLSARSTVDSWMLRDMVARAESSGIPIISASGNDNSASLYYPSGYNNQNIISVGAIDESNNRASFSNYGPSLDLVAPGTNILSTTKYNTYSSASGTSMAAPFVSGAFASLWYACRALPYGQIRDVLYMTAIKPSNYTFTNDFGWNQEVGYGILNFGNAAKFLLDSGVVYQWSTSVRGITAWSNNPAESFSGTYQRMKFGLSVTQVPGTVPVYRRYYPPNGDRILTTDINKDSYYDYEGIIGYIAQSPLPSEGMVHALHHFWKAGQGHYYTTEYSESDYLFSNGWNYAQVMGYVRY